MENGWEAFREELFGRDAASCAAKHLFNVLTLLAFLGAVLYYAFSGPNAQLQSGAAMQWCSCSPVSVASFNALSSDSSEGSSSYCCSTCARPRFNPTRPRLSRK